MPRRGGRHFVLLSRAEGAMEAFKLEVARELGILPKGDSPPSPDWWETLTTKDVGTIGGEMLRRLALLGEYVVLQRYEQGLRPLLPRIAAPNELTSVTGDALAGRVTNVAPEQVVQSTQNVPARAPLQ